jgi:hypothetical protein
MNAPVKKEEFALIKIDDGIPIPLANAMPRDVYPFKRLKAGQSFAFPANVDPVRAYKAATNANRRLKPKVFRVRKLENEIRCWRIA